MIDVLSHQKTDMVVSRESKNPSRGYKPLPIWQGKRKRFLIGVVFCGFVQGVIAIGFSLLASWGFREMKTPTHELPSDMLSWFIPLVCGLGLLVFLIRTFERVMSEKSGQDYVIQVRYRLYKRLLKSDLREAQRFSHGGKTLRFVTDLNGLHRWVSFGFARLLVGSTMVCTILIVLFLLEPIFAVLIIGALIFGLCAGLLAGSDLFQTIHSVRKYRSRLAATINDRIGSVATIQAFDQSRRELRRVKKQSNDLLAPLIKKARIVGALRGALEATAMIAIGATVALGVFFVDRGVLNSEEVFACVILIGLVSQPLRDFARVFEYWNDWRVSHEKIARFLKLRSRKSATNKTPLPDGPGQVDIENLSIPGLLDATTLTIEPKQHVIVQGENGVGKTSLLMTIAGVFPSATGKIQLDGHDVNDWLCRQGEGGIAIVSPDVELMRGSLFRNLAYANPNVTKKDVEKMIRQCGLNDWYEKLKNGLDTNVLEHGRNFSMGERNTLVFIRAMLAKPCLLLLDEFSTHLDEKNLSAINDVLSQYKGTVIRVEHGDINENMIFDLHLIMENKRLIRKEFSNA